MTYAKDLLKKELKLLQNELELLYNQPYHKEITERKAKSIKEALEKLP